MKKIRPQPKKTEAEVRIPTQDEIDAITGKSHPQFTIEDVKDISTDKLVDMLRHASTGNMDQPFYRLLSAIAARLEDQENRLNGK